MFAAVAAEPALFGVSSGLREPVSEIHPPRAGPEQSVESAAQDAAFAGHESEDDLGSVAFIPKQSHQGDKQGVVGDGHAAGSHPISHPRFRAHQGTAHKGGAASIAAAAWGAPHVWLCAGDAEG